MKTNGHITDPKEILKLNQELKRQTEKSRARQEKIKMAQPVPQPVSQVDHPKHYNSGKIEAISVIEDWNLDFHLGNTVKYICRAGKKETSSEVQDLEKAIWYIQRKLNLLKNPQ